MIFDEDGLLEEPCLSCEHSYVEDIWYSWQCDEKECPYIKNKDNGSLAQLVRASGS